MVGFLSAGARYCRGMSNLSLSNSTGNVVSRELEGLRDHRSIGIEQKLFMLHPSSPGSVFLLPHGMRIIDRLVSLLKQEYRKEGYDEVCTPLLFHKDLWKQSGHWQNYKNDMFFVTTTEEFHQFYSSHTNCSTDEGEMVSEFGLKPMNCPAHCLIFSQSPRSFRDLPMRLAEFSPLHRNELSGTLTGLTRVRKFTQDDAHIFCTPEQMADEVRKCLKFVDRIYNDVFGFEYVLALSTRPSRFLGHSDDWHRAETILRSILNTHDRPWTVREGDGAFYGPKIDISLTDYMRRSYQTATIQLDFQLPLRFELKYHAEDGQRYPPVIIHRAILGSFERFFAMLIEHYDGKWPLWLSPRQLMICPVSHYQNPYARDLALRFHHQGFHVDVDLSDHPLSRKIRDAQLQQFNFMFIVGDEELSTDSVNIRSRSGNLLGSKSIEDAVVHLNQLISTFS
jgi:threonyl-tRNA synthetase